MTGELFHPIDDIIQKLLVDLGLGSLPEDEDDWPIFSGAMPDDEEVSVPDNVISCHNTEGLKQGRTSPDGETTEKYGVQVMVRSNDLGDGYTKASRIARRLDTDVRLTEVEMDDGTIYLVRNISKTGPIISLGQERGSRRTKHAINALASITVDEVGTG